MLGINTTNQIPFYGNLFRSQKYLLIGADKIKVASSFNKRAKIKSLTGVRCIQLFILDF